jgi:Protein of unknown function (DUF2380)
MAAMTTRIIRATVVAVAAMALAPVRPVVAAERVAVFGFELLDQSQEGELIVKVRPEETRRLALLTQDLRARLASSKDYEVADVGALDGAIKGLAPLHKCDSCQADLARQAGASLAMLGLVQKFSDTLLSVSIQIIDASSGVVKSAYSVGIQGNTDEAWLRGVSYIARNKMMITGASQ